MAQNLWSNFLRRFKTIASPNVTRYVFSLGNPNATTGWYAKTYAEGVTIEMRIISKAAQFMLSGMGVYVRYDAVGLTITAVAEGDKITDSTGAKYVIESVQPHYFGDTLVFLVANLIFRGDFT